MQEHVKQEKHLMAECDCVFLVRLVAGFQDSAYLYMVLEAAMGGEFFLYMQVRPKLFGAPPCPGASHVRHACDGVVSGQAYLLMQQLSICSSLFC